MQKTTRGTEQKLIQMSYIVGFSKDKAFNYKVLQTGGGKHLDKTYVQWVKRRIL